MSSQKPTEQQKPRRIQRKRTKGWKMPENTVYVGRPSKWGNPFVLCDNTDAKKAVKLFRNFLRISQADVMKKCKDENGNDNPIGGLQTLVYRQGILKALSELRGKNLACWCKEGSPCHADVLLELANK